MFQKRFLCTQVNASKWRIKQVSKANYSESLQEIKAHISSSDFISVSLQNTGAFSAPWHRVLPFDTIDIAYAKAKYAAERFTVFQFAVCPFSIRDSKLLAHPYNFHLFPRDELKNGMPSYAFSCQTSCLTSMAREGFDFNACIYDGISYISRYQESVASDQIRSRSGVDFDMQSYSNSSVADAIFVERVKSRIANWRDACKNSSRETNEPLVRSLRELLSGSVDYGSRPCLNIDICSERQVHLTLKVLNEKFDDLVPIKIPAKGGGTQMVCIVLTSSREDKELVQRKLQNLEEEQNKKVRGFREVIDLISASQKPVVSHNSLNDFTFIYSKFVAPLPSDAGDFMCSLRLAFSRILDMNHLLKEIARTKVNMPVSISYLNRRLFVPIDTELHQVKDDEGAIHGHNVLKLSHLFAKICSELKISPDIDMLKPFEFHANILFNPCSAIPRETIEEDVTIWTNSGRKVSSRNLVFVWGFRAGTTAGMLKRLLQGSHPVFFEEFDVRLVDKSCAIVVFWKAGLSDAFLEAVTGSGEMSGSLKEMVSEGLRAAEYETYNRACGLGFWEKQLAHSMDRTLANTSSPFSEAETGGKSSEIYWGNDSAINFDDL